MPQERGLNGTFAYMPNPLSRWIKETPRGQSAGRATSLRHDECNLKFRQLVERWVEFKRLHLGFAQTLNGLLNGNSSPIYLIKQSMLCAHELEELRQSGKDPIPGERLSVETLAKRLPLKSYDSLYSLINSGALDDESLDCLIDRKNIHVAETILKVSADPIARLDNFFIALAEQDGFDSANRISKWTQEISTLNKTIVDVYTHELKERGLL